MNRLFIFVFACGLLAGCTSSTEVTTPEALANSYSAEFDTKPPPTVSHLQSKIVQIYDSYQKWLRFSADANVISGILAQGFSPSDRDEFMRGSRGGNTPEWWLPEDDHLTQFYINNNWKKHYKGDNFAWVAYDDARKIVYFSATGFD